MAEVFDPYRKWLGIPQEEQPPHHYRLLGIAPFEEDPDVIESAADQRMAHVRTYATGKYAQVSQKILNELAAAKICLLNAGKKARYDDLLRSRLDAGDAKSSVDIAALVGIDPLAHGPSLSTPSHIGRRPPAQLAQRHNAAKRPAWQLGLIIGGVVSLLVLVIGGVVVLSGKGKKAVAQADDPAVLKTPGDSSVSPPANTKVKPDPNPTPPPTTPEKPVPSTPLPEPKPEPLPVNETPRFPTPNFLALSDAPFDLLPTLTRDLEKITVLGTWQTAGPNTLITPDTANASVLIPCHAPAEYVLSFVVERRSGQKALVVGLRAGGKHVEAILGNGGGKDGFQKIAGRLVMESPASVEPATLGSSGTPVVIAVTSEQISVFVNGRLHYELRQPDPATFEAIPGRTLPDDCDCLFLANSGSPAGTRFAFRKLQMVPLTEGRFAIPDSTATQNAQNDLRRQFAAELQAAASFEAKATLSKTLRERAVQELDQPARCYAALRAAYQLALDANHRPHAEAALASLETWFAPPDAAELSSKLAGLARGTEKPVPVGSRPETTTGKTPEVPAAVDLLATVDMSANSLRGTWILDKGRLLTPAGGDGMLGLPVSLPPEYLLTIVAERTNGYGFLAAGLIHQGRPFQVAIDWVADSKHWWGLQLVGGKDARANPTTWYDYEAPRAAQKYNILVKSNRIVVIRNHMPLVDWAPQDVPVSVGNQWKSRSGTPTAHLGVNYDAQFAISRLQMLPLTGGSLPLPSGAALKTAETSIRGALSADLRASKTREQKQALADKLRTDADANLDQPLSAYVWLKMAGELCEEVGDAEGLWLAIKALTDYFPAAVDKDRGTLFVEALARSRAKRPPDVGAFARDAMYALDEVIYGGRLDKSLLAKINEALNVPTTTPAGRDWAAHWPWLRQQVEELDAAAKAEEKLTQDATDAAAHEIVGRVLCFTKDDWKNGMPHLAQGTTATWKRLAELEAAPPTEPAEQQKSLDQWSVAVSAANDAFVKMRLFSRTNYWYQRFLAGWSAADASSYKKKIDALLPKELASAKNGLNVEFVGAAPQAGKYQYKPFSLPAKRLDPTVELTTAKGQSPLSPTVTPAGWAATWTGYLAVPRAGWYKLKLDTDEPAQIVLDGETVVDGAKGGAVNKYLLGRIYELTVRAHNVNDGAQIRLHWYLYGDRRIAGTIASEFLFVDRAAAVKAVPYLRFRPR